MVKTLSLHGQVGRDTQPYLRLHPITPPDELDLPDFTHETLENIEIAVSDVHYERVIVYSYMLHYA